MYRKEPSLETSKRLGHSVSFFCSLFIGVGRFRILGGGPRFRILGGPNSQQAHDVVTTSHRHHFDVVCPLGF